MACSTSTLTREALECMLECKVADFSRYVPVFTHKSAMRLTNGQSYERYEFIGDAVINFVVAKLLFDMYPDADEGVLTRLRTRLVSGKCLARLAQHLGLHRYVIMNSRSLSLGFNTNPRILEDVFESLVGCVYLDLGLVAAKSFLLGVYRRFIDFNDIARDTNYKDGLMRYAQARGMPLPEYTVVATSADPHAAFTVRARLVTGVLGHGSGPSKKHAEQLAARELLQRLGCVSAHGEVCIEAPKLLAPPPAPPPSRA